MKKQATQAIAVMVVFVLMTISNGCPTGVGSDNGNDGTADMGGVTYTVTYHANGATEGQVPTDPVHYDPGEQVTVAGQGELVRNQHGFAWLFKGWNTESDGTGTSYPELSCMTMPSENVILYAAWTPIGATGPAGGIVFYDKEEYTGGWRYLETAPASTEWRNIEWGDFGTEIGGDAQLTDIGDGRAATDAIVDHMTGKGITNTAAQLCDELEHEHEGTTYVDWFLPSHNELHAVWNNIVDDGEGNNSGVGGFDASSYWSSSEVSAETFAKDYAWRQHFFHGGRATSKKDIASFSVRAARAF